MVEFIQNKVDTWVLYLIEKSNCGRVKLQLYITLPNNMLFQLHISQRTFIECTDTMQFVLLDAQKSTLIRI